MIVRKSLGTTEFMDSTNIVVAVWLSPGQIIGIMSWHVQYVWILSHSNDMVTFSFSLLAYRSLGVPCLWSSVSGHITSHYLGSLGSTSCKISGTTHGRSVRFNIASGVLLLAVGCKTGCHTRLQTFWGSTFLLFSSFLSWFRYDWFIFNERLKISCN